MHHADVLAKIRGVGVLGIIRVGNSDSVIEMLHALALGGIECLEITLTTPGALREIERAVSEIDGVIMGAGTVLDAPTARQAILAGARFLVTPTVCRDVIETSQRYGVATIVGAMTPTEALLAWEAGADMVKVFPASVVGPAFVREMRGPLPQIPLVPTGGITDENAGSFIRAGAAAVCAGSWLVDCEAMAEGNLDELTRRARVLVEVVREAREERR